MLVAEAAPSNANVMEASDGAEFNAFGPSESQSGTGALIGAYGDDGKGDDSGSAYYYGLSNPASPIHYKLIATNGAKTCYETHVSRHQ